MATFAERLRLLRKEKGLNQGELAQALGVSLGTVSIWERGGRKPDFDTMEEIGEFFNVSTGYVMGTNDERNIRVPTDQQLASWAAEEEHDTMIHYMIMFSKLGGESRDAAKKVISALHRMDRDSNELVEPDVELDKQLEGLLYQK